MASNKATRISLTTYSDVEDLVTHFTRAVIQELRENLVGLYLTGSLSYDAFEYRSSDIDLTAIVQRPVSETELSSLLRLHREMEQRFPEWSKRLDCTYTPVQMLPRVLPPKEGRPWYWGGTGELYAGAHYGNEWIINRYFLHNHGITLHGPKFSELAGPVDILEVQKACVRDLFVEWRPKASDEEWLASYEYWAYFILNLCRILYTVSCATASSKQIAARWVQETYGDEWADLVGAALQWGYGVEFEPKDEALGFLNFVVSEVCGTDVHRELSGELS